MSRIVIPYRPHKFQSEIHTDTTRFQVNVCHRRFGKTVLSINKGLKKALTCPHPNPRVMYLAPFKNQARKIAWDYLVHYSSPIPGIHINKQDACIDYPNGARFTLEGADNIHVHRGIYLDHLVCDEYAQMSPVIWGSVLRPALADRQGSGDFIGTPMGRGNAFHQLFERAGNTEGWSRHIYPVSQTGLIPQSELDAARLDMSEDEYLQEFECSWDAAIKGSYYAKQMAQLTATGKICDVPYEPELPVYTACDLGMRDAFSIWFFQFAGDQIRFIDYKHFFGMGLPQVFKDLEKLPYRYGDHVAPHDIKVRELGTGVARIETARKLGVNYKICRDISRQDGIDAVRNMLPRCVFDKTKCAIGVEALRIYRCKYDEQLRIFSTEPLHDWTSNPADALRYMAVTYAGKHIPDLFDRMAAPDYSQLDTRVIGNGTNQNDRRPTGRSRKTGNR